MLSNVEIYTDGGCRLKTKHSNGDWTGPGACAFVIVTENDQKFEAEFSNNTTNNRMELLAVINALTYYNTNFLVHGDSITVFSDSQYVCKGITNWIINWKRKNWKTATNKAVQNQDLWKQLDALVQTIETNLNVITFEWVKGHSTNELNNLVDNLCTTCINKNINNE